MKRIAEEQAAKERYWKIPICDDDDDNDYTIAITPVLSTKEPVHSLIMENEHLDTISATESDEFIKSSVEILVPIPKKDSFTSNDVEYVESITTNSEPSYSKVMEIVYSQKTARIVRLLSLSFSQDVSHPQLSSFGSGYQQKDRKPSQNDKTEHGMEKTVQNQGQSPKMTKSESILKNQQSNRSRN
ncbi:hypothetical protein Tco_0272051 [Tanacetum coccineum]